MKYQSKPQFSKVLADLFIQQLPAIDHHGQPPELLVPVPMHPRKQRQRGYNQAIYIANHLGKYLGIPVLHNALVKIQETDAQNSLSAEERKKNLVGSFKVNHKQLKTLKSTRHVALIDDVITTGATLQEASHCLKQVGLEQIDVWAIARTP